MKTLSIDIETFSDVQLPKTGVYRYCESSNFEILLFAYSVDAGPVEKGVYTPTEEIHHMKPLSQGGTHDRDNLKALCKACHARIHAKHGDRWHNSTER